MPYKDPEKQKAAQRAWYQSNKERLREPRRHGNRPMFTFIRKEKEKPCTDCGQTYPYYVMQFDHTGNNKVMNVTKLARCAGIERVKEEIAKCELVCANCHAARTWQRQQASAINSIGRVPAS